MTKKPPAVWAPSPNYTPGNNGSNYIIIHTTEGGFDGSVGWLRNTQSQASAHIVVSADGSRVAELVRPGDSSWAAANYAYNTEGVNIEIEGYADTGPFAEGVYETVGAWVAYYASVRGIPLQMAVDNLYSRNVVRRGVLGHMNVPGASHTDPGHDFDFEKLLAYAKGHKPKPAPALREYNIIYPATRYAQDRAAWIWRYFGKDKVLRIGHTGRQPAVAHTCSTGKFDAHKCLVFADAMMRQDDHALMEQYGTDLKNTDVFDCRSEQKLRNVIEYMGEREGKPNALKDYEKKFGSEPGGSKRGRDDILGKPRATKEQALAVARKRGANMSRARQAADAIWAIQSDQDAAPDFRFAQSLVETGNFHYGNDSVWPNLAGNKKGGPVGDEPEDFLRPATVEGGANIQANHWRAYCGFPATADNLDTRYGDAYQAQQSRGHWIRHISEIGGGIWAGDPTYATKIRDILDEMERAA